MHAHAGPSSSTPVSTPSSSSSAAGKPDRLFVGNLAPTVDEYTLIQVFQKYGKITKLDFMFHKSGVLKGKPRGYAFVEFSNKDDALKAMVKLHDRLLRGRKLVVTYANSAPVYDLPLSIKGRRSTEAAKTTTLSLLKTRRHPQSASAQIAAMEAKLATMAKTKPADEDYVPGSSTYPLGAPGSGTSSPIPDISENQGEQAMEDVLGMEEGEKAADDLQRELEAELKGDVAVTNGSLDEQPSSPNVEQSTLPSNVLGLPSKPNRDASVTKPSPDVEDKAKAKQDAFNRGLAGLPKKPVF